MRIVGNVDKELDELYKERTMLRNKEDKESKVRLQKVEDELADKFSEDFYKKIKEEIKGINSEEGGWNSGHLWCLKKKLFPMAPDPPTAMLDSEGKLVTDPNDVTDAAMKYFKQVL